MCSSIAIGTHVRIVGTPVFGVKYPADMGKNAAFAEWFRGKLAEFGEDKAEFVERSGIPLRTVTSWYNGERLPSARNADKLADLLNERREVVWELAGHLTPEPGEILVTDARYPVLAMLEKVDAGNQQSLDRLWAVKALMRELLREQDNSQSGGEESQ